MKFYVSRQISWPDGQLSVEIVQGGSDYANPRQLSARWPHLGEGNTFNDPRKAVEAALRIKEIWSEIESEPIDLTFGATAGMTIDLPEYTDEDLLAQADQIYEKLPKCDQCGELLGDETYTHPLAFDSERFDTRNCADAHFLAQSEPEPEPEESDETEELDKD